MQTKKNTIDIHRSNSGNSHLSLSTMDEGNKPENGIQGEMASQDSKEARDGNRAEKKNLPVEGFRGGKDARSSINQGSPTSGSKEWAQENVNKGPKTHKNRYWNAGLRYDR